MRPTRAVLVPFALLILACSGDMWRSCTAKVVGKSVETTKEVSSGVAEGFKEGRKAGQSVDGATLVSSWEELGEHGTVGVYSATPAGTDDALTLLTMSLENHTDVPLRFVDLKVAALDVEGFVVKIKGSGEREITVPPNAKDRAAWTFAVAPARLGEIRVWDRPVESPPAAAPADDKPAAEDAVEAGDAAE